MTASAGGRSHARLVIPLGLATGLSLFGAVSLYAGLVPQLDQVGLTLAQVGVLFSIHRLVRLPGNPLAGGLMDRFGRRRLFLAGTLLGALSTAGYAVSHGFLPFLIARVMWGCAWALINVGGMTMIIESAPAQQRGRLSGQYNAWVLVGYATGPLLGGFLIDKIGFSSAMLVCAGIQTVGLLPALVLLPETGAPAGRAAPQGLNPLRSLWRSVQIAISTSPAAAAALILFCVVVFGGDGVLLATTSLLLQQRLGSGIHLDGAVLGIATASGILIGVFALSGSFFGPLAGRLSDRVGRVPVIAAALLAGTAGFGGLILARSLPAVLACVALGAFSYGAGMSTITAYMGDLAPVGNTGAIMGAFATAGDLGATIGPALSFALVPLAGLTGVYALAALVFLLGLLLLARRTDKG